MYNTKEKVQFVLLIIAILVIPLIFISLEFIDRIRKVSEINTDEMIIDSLDLFYNDITSKPQNSDSANIRTIITEIFNFMNEKDYDNLYALLTDDIKNLMFPSQDIFEDYMETYLGDEIYSPKFSKYERLNREENIIFVLNVDFLPRSTSEINISTNTVPQKSDIFTIYLNDDLTYKFSFLKYIGSGTSSKSILENDVFSCKLVSTHLYTSNTVFNIEFTNKTESDIFIDKNGISAITGLSPKYYSASILIPTNDTSTINFTIYTGFNLRESLPSEIEFTGIRTNGKVYLFTLPIKYPISLYNF